MIRRSTTSWPSTGGGRAARGWGRGASLAHHLELLDTQAPDLEVDQAADTGAGDVEPELAQRMAHGVTLPPDLFRPDRNFEA